jgi:hypothetical protein
MLAASALAQTATKPPAKPAPATKTAAAAPRPSAAHPVARPVGVHPTIIPRRPVFVPPPPVIELDEIAVVPDLPTVLDTDTRETYRRIFQAQASGQFAQADADIARLKDKTLMGDVGAQRLLSPGHPATFDQLAAWLQEYNDHPDAPAIYRLALARRTPGSSELTPASFVSQAPSSPSFAAARTVTGADAGRAAELRARLQGMADDGGFNAAFALLDQKSTADVLGPQPTGTRPSRASSAATWPIRRGASRWWPMRRPTGPRRGRCRPVRSGRRAPTCWPAIRRNSRPISSVRRCTAAPSMA